MAAPREMLAELADALDSLLGIIALLQEDRSLPDDVLSVLDELAKIAEQASVALARVGKTEAPPVPEREGFAPAAPISRVPITRGRGGGLGMVIRATTPNYGLESE